MSRVSENRIGFWSGFQRTMEQAPVGYLSLVNTKDTCAKFHALGNFVRKS